MLKIKDFAQIAQVSMSALRYYDDIGIFKPSQVDPDTGYRFYTMAQLVELNRILALKDLGINLRKIVELLDDDVPDERLYELLKLRQAQLEQTIDDAQDTLARIEARVKHIEQGSAVSLPEVVIKSVGAQTVVSSFSEVEGYLPNFEYAQDFQRMVQRQDVALHGYNHFIYHMQDECDPPFKIELAIPLKKTDQLARIVWEWPTAVVVRELPEVPEMASVIHQGSPYGIAQAYEALGHWIEQNQFSIQGPCRKCCLQWDGLLDTYITEIQFPIQTRSRGDL